MALRQQVWVDRSVQGVLVGRVVLYWICGLLYVGIGTACFQYNQNPDWTLAKHAYVLFGQVWPWLPTAFILLPLAIYDVVRLSNLFAGPVWRLRKHFAALREDIACAPLLFREEDYWRDLAAPINDMQAEILRLRAGVIELQKAAARTAEAAAKASVTPSDDTDIAASVDENGLENGIEATGSSSEVNHDPVPEGVIQPATDVGEVAIAPLPASTEGQSSVAVPAN